MLEPSSVRLSPIYVIWFPVCRDTTHAGRGDAQPAPGEGPEWDMARMIPSAALAPPNPTGLSPCSEVLAPETAAQTQLLPRRPQVSRRGDSVLLPSSFQHRQAAHTGSHQQSQVQTKPFTSQVSGQERLWIPHCTKGGCSCIPNHLPAQKTFCALLICVISLPGEIRSSFSTVLVFCWFVVFFFLLRIGSFKMMP